MAVVPGLTVDSFPPFVIGIFGTAIVGFVAWTVGSVMKSRDELHKLELKMQDDYVRKDAFNEFRREFKQLSVLMYEIAGKLGIPVRRE
jgi:hypothetical protein